MSLASDFEQTIHSHCLPGLEGCLQGEGFVLPHYGGFSITNLPATIAGLLGRDLEGAAPSIPQHAWVDLAGGVRTVVMVILDAVGYMHLRQMLEEGDSAFSRMAQDGRFVPLTSVFPSTTMAALTTLWTGRPPGEHGFLGSRLFLSELGVLADMIRLTPAAHVRPGTLLEWGWVPEQFISVPHAAQLLAPTGVQTITHLYGLHAAGGLARLFLQGVASVHGYVGHSDMWINVRETLLQRSEQPLVVNVYWSGTDDVAHTYGPDGERFRAALRHMSRSLEEGLLRALPAAAREGTVLLITADHGQTATPPERAVHLAEHRALQEMLLLPPAAEPRAAYLYVRPGQASAVRAYVDEHLANRFLVLGMDEAVAGGLFGSEVPPGSRVRLGDLLLLAREDSRLVPVGESASHRGHHGSLTPEEMLVPLLMTRLDG